MIQVSELLHLKNTPDTFKAGNISQYYDQWSEITKDKYLLGIVKNGYQLEFQSHPCKQCNRQPIKFNTKEENIIANLIDKFWNKGIIEISRHEQGEVISHIFFRPKPDGSYRLILNLSKLNEHVVKTSFKMETLRSALQLIRKDCYFAKIDLKDAFYSIPIHQKDRKFLKFMWQGRLFQFTCLPNGLGTASKIFTKVLKPVFSTLRKMGHSNVAYIDDSLLQSDNYIACTKNIQDTLNLVDSVGLTVHQDKSVVIPNQCIEFLGFLLNSVNMTVRLSHKKASNIKMVAEKFLMCDSITIREFAQLIGKLIAAEPGVLYGPLYYKTMELERDLALKHSYGNFDNVMQLSLETRSCLQWWIKNVENSYKPISFGPPNRKIETDSSLFGYGGHDITNNADYCGTWKKADKSFHINYLELKAAFLCLKHFCKHSENEHIHLFLDNMVAIKYLNKMGGRKQLLNNLAREIWLWCEKKKLWLSVFHIPGILNSRADELSRSGIRLTEDMEWSLQQDIFDQLQRKMGVCEIDLFASVKNFKIAKYAAYMPDNNAYAINAFSVNWNETFNYAFPPFSQLCRLVQKLCEDSAEMILIAPLFPTQPWFPRILQQVCGQSYILPKTSKILHLTGSQKKHRLTSMRMAAFRLSGSLSSVQDYQGTLQTSSCIPGDRQHPSSMGLITKDGCHFVIGNKLLHLIHL